MNKSICSNETAGNVEDAQGRGKKKTWKYYSILSKMHTFGLYIVQHLMMWWFEQRHQSALGVSEYQWKGRDLLQFHLCQHWCAKGIIPLGHVTINTDAKMTWNDFTYTFSVHNVGINTMIWLKPETRDSQVIPGSHESNQGQKASSESITM